jgi:hypothetical protein
MNRVSTANQSGCPAPRREQAFRHRLAAWPGGVTAQVPIATATAASAACDGPAGPAWLPAGQPGPRRRLALLLGAWPPAVLAADPPGSEAAGPSATGLPWHAPAPCPPPAGSFRIRTTATPGGDIQ